LRPSVWERQVAFYQGAGLLGLSAFPATPADIASNARRGGYRAARNQLVLTIASREDVFSQAACSYRRAIVPDPPKSPLPRARGDDHPNASATLPKQKLTIGHAHAATASTTEHLLPDSGISLR